MKKGFASMTIVYSFLLVFLLTLVSLLALYTQKARFADTIVSEGKKEIEGYRTSHYTYTGNYQEFTAEYTGWHKVELWGASGGNSSFGNKTSGIVYLSKNEKLYIYMGEGGSNSNTNCLSSGIKYNGGGLGGYLSESKCGSDGGGATDIRYFGDTEPQTPDLLWNSTLGLNSRIMVASGGTGWGYPINPAYKSLCGINYMDSTYQEYFGKPGTQLGGGAAPTKYSAGQTTGTAGSFGIGGSGGINASSATSGSGGGSGGGYYGGSGGSGISNGTFPGGGGSSFISGYAGVNAITSSSNRTHTNNTKHYSNKYFIDGEMQAGVNTGNGKAKITYVGANNPARINTKLNNVRYIKDCVNGNTANALSQWVELQAIYNGVNIAYGKQVIDVSEVHASYPYSRITDGLTNTDDSSYARPLATSGSHCITVDLGQLYNLDEIGVWHYWLDNRTYYSNTTYVSSDNDNWMEVINEVAPETSEGKRVSAYENVVNGYVGKDLVLMYDGISNTGTTHSTSSTTWKNLASASYTGTVNGPIWGADHLSFDGIDDWVSIGVLNNDYATLEIVFSFNDTDDGYLLANYQNGGIGLYYNNSFLLSSAIYASGSYKYLYGPVLTKNEIYNSSLTYNGSNIYLYQAAIEVASEAKSGVIGIPTSSTVMALGVNPNGSNPEVGYLKGKIYSVRIYSRGLTEDEVKHNYEVDKLRFNLE